MASGLPWGVRGWLQLSLRPVPDMSTRRNRYEQLSQRRFRAFPPVRVLLVLVVLAVG
jgi:hypothetical protein